MTAALEGQRCVVTGANTGIGFEIASALAGDGADVTLVCRNPDRGAAAVDAIRDATGNPRVRLAVCDVGDPGAVRACCETLSNGGRTSTSSSTTPASGRRAASSLPLDGS